MLHGIINSCTLQFWSECGCCCLCLRLCCVAGAINKGHDSVPTPSLSPGFELSTGGWSLLSLRLIYLKPPPATSNVAEPSTTWALFTLCQNGCQFPSASNSSSKLKSHPPRPISQSVNRLQREPISWANGNRYHDWVLSPHMCNYVHFWGMKHIHLLPLLLLHKCAKKGGRRWSCNCETAPPATFGGPSNMRCCSRYT